MSDTGERDGGCRGGGGGGRSGKELVLAVMILIPCNMYSYAVAVSFSGKLSKARDADERYTYGS